MKHLFRLPLYLLLGVIALCVLSIFFGIGDRADVPLDWTLGSDDMARAKAILHEGSKTRPETIGTLELSKEDLNLAANYLLNRYSKSAAQISLKKNQLKFTATLTLPENDFGKYLNITVAFGNVEDQPLPILTKFKAGKLLLPSRLAAFAIDSFIRHSSLNNYFILATRPIKNVTIEPEKITITYFSSLETLVQAKHFLTHGDDGSVLELYRQQINQTVDQHDPRWRLSLAELLQSVFLVAAQRSTLKTAITENRMAILAVNDYVNKSAKPLDLATLSGEDRYYPAFLYQRNDLAQHFIGSAALAASLDGQVASALGEEKELSDSQPGGSGFSFADLAADKAGTRLGETAVASPEAARKLQQAMSTLKDYRDVMPDPSGLPEHMDAAEFKKRYQSTHSEAYRRLLRQIDEQIANLAIYQRQ